MTVKIYGFDRSFLHDTTDADPFVVDMVRAQDYLKAEAEVTQLNEQVRALSEFKSTVRQLLRMGELAEDFAVIINIENALRRSSCLSAVEYEFFTREVPDEDHPDEMCEECNLNWGKLPGEYVLDFAVELNEVRAQVADDLATEFGRIAQSLKPRSTAYMAAKSAVFKCVSAADRIRKGEQP